MKKLAEQLRTERMRRSLTVDQISERTCISTDVIRAMEAGRYEQIDTPLLIRSFLQAYCEALGLDPEEVLEPYACRIKAYDRQEERFLKYRICSRGLLDTGGRVSPIKITILALVLVNLLYGGPWALKSWKRSEALLRPGDVPSAQADLPSDLPAAIAALDRATTERKVASGSDPYASPVTREMAGRSMERIEAPGSAEPKAGASEKAAGMSEALLEDRLSTPSRAQHRLVIEADEKTRIQVKTGSGPIQKVTMQPGERREWIIREAVRITVGNAGGVRLQWDGQRVQVPGRPGSVVRLRLPYAKAGQGRT